MTVPSGPEYTRSLLSDSFLSSNSWAMSSSLVNVFSVELCSMLPTPNVPFNLEVVCAFVNLDMHFNA